LKAKNGGRTLRLVPLSRLSGEIKIVDIRVSRSSGIIADIDGEIRRRI
jgi:hypothetical protein